MTFVSFDTETTGLDPRRNEAIEIAAVLLRSDNLCPTTERFVIKLKIEHPECVSPGVLGVYNHYDQAVWDREAVGQLEGWQKFCDWIFRVAGHERAILVGQNITGFDYPLMEYWCGHFGLKPHVNYHPEELLAIYANIKRRLRQPVGKSNLNAIAKFFGIENPQAHSALDDANTAGACFALAEAYQDILIDCGRIEHNTILNEAWYRIGYPRTPDYQPLRPRQ